MPIIQSSIKDLRRTARRTARNRAAVGALRSAVRKVQAQIARGDGAGARSAFAAALPLLDRAADRGFIHKNAAARTKSRLMAKLGRLGAPAAKS